MVITLVCAQLGFVNVSLALHINLKKKMVIDSCNQSRFLTALPSNPISPAGPSGPIAP